MGHFSTTFIPVKTYKFDMFSLVMDGKTIIRLSKRVVSWIKPYCRRVMVVGSIRRRVTSPGDIDIILIPKNQASKEKLEKLLELKGKRLLGGEKKAYFKIDGVEVEVYYTIPEEWGATL